MKLHYIVPIFILCFSLIASCKKNVNSQQEVIEGDTVDSSLYPIGTDLRELIFSKPASYDTALVYSHKSMGKDTILRRDFDSGGWKKYNSKDRVEAELEKFLEFDFFPRVGGGIGMTRMIAALDKK